jgi:hypothetical protein
MKVKMIKDKTMAKLNDFVASFGSGELTGLGLTVGTDSLASNHEVANPANAHQTKVLAMNKKEKMGKGHSDRKASRPTLGIGNFSG